ncbi:MAG: hypothetical protein CR978_01765 [Gammaproteobacteria bacterium]|nr:MAG: hypothetical protein CR978_01765 [Gammaproteobacteria bacterium]PIE38574.1 MAG: hypothetical protein CSA53_04070 [Gammaproteobacteria bacterium]
MQDLQQLLPPHRVLCRRDVGSMKSLFTHIADAISQDSPDIATPTIIKELNAREKLGSTGLGDGIAIPHTRLEGLEKPCGCLITLVDGIDFDAPDNKKVDIVFALLVPSEANGEHLQILSSLAKLFVQPEFCQRLRAAENAQALHELVLNWPVET